MRIQVLPLLAAALVLVGTTACATKGYVTTKVEERTRTVERRVNEVERSLEDTTVGTGRNAARIAEVDHTATAALETADTAVGASARAQSTANDAEGGVRDLATAGRRLLFEVILTEDHGQFGFADASLPSATSTKLDEFVTRVGALAAGVHVEIEGHTDATGPADYNTRLALRRAEAVRRYLHERHGLPLHKINLISYGEEKPAAPNDTIEGRATNRRVVVRVLG